MKKNVLHKNNIELAEHCKLWLCLALGALVLAVGCKQANGRQSESNEMTIIVKGDAGVEVKEPNSFKVKKSSSWKSIKQKAIEKITTKENKEIKEWRIKDESGEVITDSQIFEKDETVFVVSGDIKTTYTVIIEGDERVKLATPNTIEIPCNTLKTFADIKDEVLSKVSLKSEWKTEFYAVYDFKVKDEEGEQITDATQISDNMTIYIRSNYTKFKWNKTIIEGYDGEEPKGRIIIPKHVSKINKSAFYGCKLITGVDLSGCKELTELEDAKGYYEKGIFQDCIALESVNMTGCSKLEGIGNKSFSGCTALKVVNLTNCSTLIKVGDILIQPFFGCISLKTVNLTGCSEVTRICLSDTGLAEIDISVCTKLNYLYLSNTAITSIDISKCPKLIVLDLSNTTISNIEISKCTDLGTLNLSNTEVTNIDVSNCSQLTYLYLGSKGITSIDVSKCFKLIYLDLSNTKITSIDVSKNLKLETLYLSNTSITNIDLSKCIELTSLYLNNTAIANIDLSKNTKLTWELDLRGTGITSVDLSKCTELQKVNFENCKELQSMDLTQCTKMSNIGWEDAWDEDKKNLSFSGCPKAEVKLSSHVTEVLEGAFGKDEDTWCKKVLVPNATIKELVKSSGYPEERTELY